MRNIHKMKRAILCLIFIFIVSPLFAETIIFKSGKKIEGKILQRTDKYIKVDFLGVTLTYFLDEIESIEGQKILFEESIAETTYSIDKKELLEKTREANKGIKRMQIKAITEQDMRPFMFIAVEDFRDVDFEQRIMHMSSQLKDYDIDVSAFPSEKKTEMSSEKLSGMQSGMDNMIEEMKKKKTEAYLADKTLYVNVNNKWVKSELPSADVFWQLYSASREIYDKKDFNNAAEKLPVEFKDVVSSVFFRLLGNYDNATSIKEDSFQGKVCYVVDFDISEDIDEIKDALTTMDNTTGREFNQDELKLDTSSMRRFISKNNFLILGTQINISTIIPSSTNTKMFINKEFIYSYPSGKIELPSELSYAVPMK